MAEFKKLGANLTNRPREREDDGSVRVWAINWLSLTAFLDCATQWRVLLGATGLIYLGLDYAAVAAVLRTHDAGPEVFADLRVMEAEALGPLNEARP